MDPMLYPRRRAPLPASSEPSLFDVTGDIDGATTLPVRTSPGSDRSPAPAPSSRDVAPDVRSPAPAAPGSETSRAAAEAIDVPFRRASLRKIMIALAQHDVPISRHALSLETALPVNVLCARLPELIPLWVAVVPGACESHAKPGLHVDGFLLTSTGRDRVRAAPGTP